MTDPILPAGGPGSAAQRSDGRIPSPLVALGIWASAAMASLAVSAVVATAAAAHAIGHGISASKLVSDPSLSPLLWSPAWIALGTLANEIALLATVVVWMALLKPPRAAVLPLARPSFRAVCGVLLLVFGLAPAAEALGELVHRVVEIEATATQIVATAARRASLAELAVLLVALALLPAIAEEALFRGLLTSSFLTRSWTAAVVGPSILFGLVHLEPTQVAGTTLLGVGFAVGRLYSGSLVATMIAHGVYNAAVIVTVRYSDAAFDHRIELAPLAVGALAAVAGFILLRYDEAGRAASARTA